MDTSSFIKGEEFEDYVQNTLFVEDRYKLMSRTADYKQNSERYVEDSMDPDFKFMCLKTKRVFYVEVKYRSKFVEDKVQIMKFNQFNRFIEIHRSKHPVFIAIGYEGSPSNPGAVSLIRIDHVAYLDLYRSVLKKHEIKRGPFENEFIEKIIHEEVNENQNKEKTVADKSTPFKFNSIKNIIIYCSIALGLLVSSYYLLKDNRFRTDRNEPNGFSHLNNSATEQILKDNIFKYYEALKANNSDALGYFLSSRLDRWYGKSNVDVSYINNDNRRYFERYPFRDVQIQWESFNAFELPNGDFSVCYNIFYKIKTSIRSTYKEYNLKINSIWNREFKIKSMYEEKLK